MQRIGRRPALCALQRKCGTEAKPGIGVTGARSERCDGLDWQRVEAAERMGR